ncbi:MAG: DUF6143 family protein [Clostridium sp.]
MKCYNNSKPVKVSMEYPLYESEKGDYFIGQTPILSGQNQHSLALLKNPHNSNKIIYLNTITLTNISGVNLSAEFYLKSNVNNPLVSSLVSCVNTAIIPEPLPKGQIQYVNSPTTPPTGGVSIFSRIVPGSSTLVVDGGQIILAPGQSISVYIGGFSPVTFTNIRFAFGWWEEKIHPCNNYCC